MVEIRKIEPGLAVFYSPVYNKQWVYYSDQAMKKFLEYGTNPSYWVNSSSRTTGREIIVRGELVDW